MNSTPELLAQIEKKRETAKLLHKMVLFLIICAVAFSFLTPALLAVFCPAAILCLFFSRRQSLLAEELLGEAQTVRGLCSTMSDVTYRGRDLWSDGDFRAMALLPLGAKKGSLLCRHSFSARYQSRAVEGSEITLHYDVSGAKNPYRFLSGSLLRGEGGGEADALLLRKGLLDPAAEEDFLSAWGYSLSPLEDPALEKHFLLAYRSDEKLSEEQLRRVAKAFKTTDHLAAVRLAPQGSAVFLARRFYTTVLPKGPLNKEVLEQSALPEAKACLDLLL